MQAYHWPGNVRELENFVRRALAVTTGTVAGPDLFAEKEMVDASSKPELKAGQPLRDVERELIERTLEANGGNRTLTARMLGVSLRTVRNKIREYGLPARTLR